MMRFWKRFCKKITVEFYKDNACQWRWRAKAGNGKIIGMASEAYHDKKDCVKSFKLIRKSFFIAYVGLDE